MKMTSRTRILSSLLSHLNKPPGENRGRQMSAFKLGKDQKALVLQSETITT